MYSDFLNGSNMHLKYLIDTFTIQTGNLIDFYEELRKVLFLTVKTVPDH